MGVSNLSCFKRGPEISNVANSNGRRRFRTEYREKQKKDSKKVCEEARDPKNKENAEAQRQELKARGIHSRESSVRTPIVGGLSLKPRMLLSRNELLRDAES
jgi:hypothetical protein